MSDTTIKIAGFSLSVLAHEPGEDCYEAIKNPGRNWLIKSKVILSRCRHCGVLYEGKGACLIRTLGPGY